VLDLPANVTLNDGGKSKSELLDNVEAYFQAQTGAGEASPALCWTVPLSK
jgi:hypothetical protein